MQVYREITPITNSDVYVLLDSIDKGFDYPIHNHPEYELTLVTNSSGNRIVGDSTQTYIDHDLVLLGPYLFHKWDDEMRDPATRTPCRVITVQFDMHLFDKQFLSRRPFYKVKSLLERAGRGIRFAGEAYERACVQLVALSQMSGMEGVIGFLQLLDLLSHARDYQYLASEGFDAKTLETRSTRLHAAYQYVIKNFQDPDLKMRDVAAAVHLSDSAFSHFFKKSTNKSFTRFLISMRLGYACKRLLETDDLVRQVCMASGFNNVANFNRLFKKDYHCTPQAYRQKYAEETLFDWSAQRSPGQFLPMSREVHPDYRPTYQGTRLVHS